MSKKSIVLSCIVVGFVCSAQGSTLFHWTFDGAAGQELISDTDIVSAYVAEKFYDVAYDSNSGYDVNYGEANPTYNGAGTSADYWNDPALNDSNGVGIRVEDPGGDSLLDLSAVTECTIEAFVYPRDKRQSVIMRKYQGDGVYFIDTREGGNFATRLAGGGEDITDNNGICYDLVYETEEWYHIALVWDGTEVRFYVNGDQSQDFGTAHGSSIPYTGGIDDSETALGIGCIIRDNDAPPSSSGQFFFGRIDEVRISDVALPVSQFLLNSVTGSASRPSPANRSVNLCDGVTLRWTSGAEAEYHDVYFGTDFDDVNDADTTSAVYVNRQSVDVNYYTPSGLELDTTYYWRIDEVNTVDPNLWKGAVWEFTTNDGSAFDPDPADEQTVVPFDVVLGWSQGCLAESHDVYFGTDYNEVNDATTDNHPNVEYGNVDVTNYDPGTELDYKTVYYWRVDEVGASQEWKGTVWSFRSQSPIIDPNMVAHYTLDEDAGDMAYDFSGYEHNAGVDGPDEGPDWDANDGHFGGSLGFSDDTDVECPQSMMNKISNGVTVALWLKDADRPGEDNWVFGVSGAGNSAVQAAVAEGSTGEVLWRAGSDTNDVIRWDLNGGTAGNIDGWHHWAFVKNEVEDEISIYFDGFVMESNDIVDDTLVNVRNRQMSFGVAEGHANDFEGRMDDIRVFDKALSAKEVASVYRGGDLSLSWGPEPGDFARDVLRDTTLTWRPGDYVDLHDVYFGTSFDDVNDADTTSDVYVDRRGANSYDPPGDLALNTTYYWRIDEVNTTDPNLWKGAVWTFKAANFIVVDGFETYTSSNDMYLKWKDGWENDTGSTLLLSAPGDPTHGADKSQLYSYNNMGTPYYSEAERVLGAGEQDFTEAGVDILTMYFYGKSTNTATTKEQLYAGLDDGGTYAEVRYGTQEGESITDIQVEDWTEWNVALSDFTDVTLSSVDGLFIGFGSRSASSAGGMGLVFFDDIRISPSRCVPSKGVMAADLSGNCVVDIADVGIMGTQWLLTDVNFPDRGITVSEPSTSNLVGFWKLEGNGDDSSGKGNSGVPEGTYSWVTGYDGVNQAIEFDGGKVLVPDHATLRPASVVSAACWVYYDGDPGESGRVVVKSKNDFEAYCIEMIGAYEFKFYVGDVNGTRYHAPSEEGDVRPGEWLHVGGTYDGTTVKSYVNGLVVGTEEANSIPLCQDTNGLAIGNRSDANDKPYAGIVDEVRVYNVALSQAEMAWLATDGEGYVPLRSNANLYDEESEGNKSVNMRDYAELMLSWLDEKLWPRDY